jgi:hypothetical protein
LGALKLGDVSLDGTKIHANANKHKSLSWDYANKLEEQLRLEVEALLRRAEAGEAAAVPGMKIDEEVARRRDTSKRRRSMRRSWPSVRKRRKSADANWEGVRPRHLNPDLGRMIK